MPTKDIELAIREVIDAYRKTLRPGVVIDALRLQAELVARDDTWPSQSEDVEPIGEAPKVEETESEKKRNEAAEEAAKVEPAVDEPAPAEAEDDEDEDEGEDEAEEKPKAKAKNSKPEKKRRKLW